MEFSAGCESAAPRILQARGGVPWRVRRQSSHDSTCTPGGLGGGGSTGGESPSLSPLGCSKNGRWQRYKWVKGWWGGCMVSHALRARTDRPTDVQQFSRRPDRSRPAAVRAAPSPSSRAAVRLADLPPADRLEIAFAGRSNVGKSSLDQRADRHHQSRAHLEHAGADAGAQHLREPACATLRIVDMPGYGFAKAPEQKVEAVDPADPSSTSPAARTCAASMC